MAKHTKMGAFIYIEWQPLILGDSGAGFNDATTPGQG